MNDWADRIQTARQLRRQGHLIGEIAHLIDWPELKSLKMLQEILDREARISCSVQPRGPIYRSIHGND